VRVRVDEKGRGAHATGASIRGKSASGGRVRCPGAKVVPHG
jgi:hypothetical protein